MPCQPFSAAGRRKGTDDERHLWPYFAQAIRVLRPRYVVLENVAGHRSMGFDHVLADLAGLRYDAQWCSVRACDVGAPHRRERLFALATDTTTGRSEARLTQSAPHQGRQDADRGNPRHSGNGPVNLLPTPTGRDGKGANPNRDGGTDLPGALLPTPEAKNSHAGPDYARMNREGSGGHDLVTALALLPTHAASDGTGGGRHPDARQGHSRQLIDHALLHGSARWGKYAPAIQRWESLTRPAPSPTEPNKNGNPRLSAAFAEWMMGWPQGLVTDADISRNDQLRIIGNGVVPQQAVAALQWLLTVSEAVA